MKRSIQSLQRKVIQLFGKIVVGSVEMDIAEADIDVTANSLSESSHGLVTGDRILFTEDASPTALSIDAAEVTNATDNFESTAHGFITGTKILVTEDNTLPSGLSTATNYYVIKVDADNFQLASSYANAIAGTEVAISDDGTGANSYDAVPAPGALTTANQYWVIKVDADSFKLAANYANAIAGTAIDITDQGAGSNEYDLVEEIDGLDKHQISIKATAVGTYALTLPSAYALQDISVIANSVAVDKACTVSVSGQVVTIKVNDIDETAALSDGYFHFLIVGSEVSDRI